MRAVGMWKTDDEKREERKDLLVILAGYCIHITVPKLFLHQVRKSMGRNYRFPLVGGAMNRGESEAHDRRKFLIH